MSHSRIQRIDKNNVKSFIDSTKTFIFDCDGVLWHSGDLLPKTNEFLDLLRGLGKRIFFVTNNSTSSRKSYLDKMVKLGINVKKEEIYCSSYAASSYLKHLDFKKKAYVIGEGGIFDEMKEAGIETVGKSELVQYDMSDIIDFKPDPEIGAVVVGFDRWYSYYKTCYAYSCLTENPGCIFIATNTDSTFPASGGRLLPGIGANVFSSKGGGTCVSPISTALGREPVVVGKPSTWLLEALIRDHQLEPQGTCMVGDRLETDILFGIQGNLHTLLVLTGVATESHLAESKIIPEFLADSLEEIFTLYSQ